MQDVVYEGIGALCFRCGRVGHKREGCPYVVRSVGAVADGQQRQENYGAVCEVVVSEVEAENKEEDGYGPWMMVGWRKPGPKHAKSGSPSNANQVGSSSLVVGSHSLVRATKFMREKEVQVGQPSLSNPKLISNGQVDSNGQIVGPKEGKAKTMDLSTTGDLIKGISVPANTNTCMVEKPHEFDGSKVSSVPSDGQGKGLTKHGRGKSTRTQKQKKLKVLSAGVSQQKGKQNFNKSVGGGNHGRAPSICNVEELAVLGDQEVMEICLEELPGRFTKAGLLRIRNSNGNGREQNGREALQWLPSGSGRRWF